MHSTSDCYNYYFVVPTCLQLSSPNLTSVSDFLYFPECLSTTTRDRRSIKLNGRRRFIQFPVLKEHDGIKKTTTHKHIRSSCTYIWTKNKAFLFDSIKLKLQKRVRSEANSVSLLEYSASGDFSCSEYLHQQCLNTDVAVYSHHDCCLIAPLCLPEHQTVPGDRTPTTEIQSGQSSTIPFNPLSRRPTLPPHQ